MQDEPSHNPENEADDAGPEADQDGEPTWHIIFGTSVFGKGAKFLGALSEPLDPSLDMSGKPLNGGHDVDEAPCQPPEPDLLDTEHDGLSDEMLRVREYAIRLRAQYRSGGIELAGEFWMPIARMLLRGHQLETSNRSLVMGQAVESVPNVRRADHASVLGLCVRLRQASPLEYDGFVRGLSDRGWGIAMRELGQLTRRAIDVDEKEPSKLREMLRMDLDALGVFVIVRTVTILAELDIVANSPSTAELNDYIKKMLECESNRQGLALVLENDSPSSDRLLAVGRLRRALRRAEAEVHQSRTRFLRKASA